MLGMAGSSQSASSSAGRLLHAAHGIRSRAEHQVQAGIHHLRLCELQTALWAYVTARRLHKIHVHGCKTMQVLVRMQSAVCCIHADIFIKNPRTDTYT